MSEYRDPFLNRNRALLRELRGSDLLHLSRVSAHGDQKLEPWAGVEDLVLEFSNQRTIALSIDEGKSNVLLFEKKGGYEREFSNRLPLIEDGRGIGKLSGINPENIRSLGILRKNHAFEEWHAMSGIYFECGRGALCIGTRLRTTEIQETAVLLKAEVSPDYEFHPL